jgi:hypothetical protein
MKYKKTYKCREVKVSVALGEIYIYNNNVVFMFKYI